MKLLQPICFWLFSGLSILSTAAGRELSFDNISVHEGLSDQTVRCIIQDHVGYMWFGTNNGLNRYDGKEIVSYYNVRNDPGSLKGNIIYRIFEDSRKNLWVGTRGGGLSLYNRDLDIFHTFLHQPDDAGSIRHNDIWAIYEDSRSNLWIATQMGLERYNYETGTFEKHLDDYQPNWESLYPRHKAFSSITEAPDGNLWIGVWKFGILIYDPDQRKVVRHLTHEPGNPNSLGTNEINSLYTDNQGNIWVGTYKGPLDCVYWQDGDICFEKYFSGTGKQCLSDNRIHFIIQQSENIFWIGSENGLNILDKQKGTIEQHYYHADPSRSLTSNHLLSGYRAPTGIIWLGTHEAGISVYDPGKLKFFPSYPSINQATGQDGRFVKSIFVDSERYLWVGTDQGLNKLTNTGELIESYTTGNSLESLDIGGVTGIVEDRDNNFWIGTWGGGLHLFNKTNKKFKRYGYSALTAELVPDQLSNPNIRAMALDSSGNIIIGTTAGNLDIFNPKTEKFQHYICMDVDSFNMIPVSAICPEKDGSIWVGLSENGGVIHFDFNKNKFTRYYSKESGENGSLNCNDVLSLYNEEKFLWIGTKLGLNLLKKETGEVKFMDHHQDLINKSILRIEKDSDGNLWLSTIEGLFKYEFSIERLFHYDRKDGAMGASIASWKCEDSCIYFGGINGLFSFKPADIQHNSLLPPVVFTGFSISNKPVTPSENGSPLSKHINHTDQIILNHLQTSFAFEFSALNYTLPEKNQFRYKLEGFDQEWVNAGTRNHAFYTNLGPGEYTFMVQGSNNDGIWNQVSKIISLKVLPAPWKTWWAYSIYFVLIVMLLLIVRYFIVSRGRLETQLILEKHIHERDLELSKKNMEINAMKIRFFTNISHEFRTPLTLILGPLEKIHHMSSNADMESLVGMIQRNAQRLLRLVNQLLDLSKIEAGFMKLEVAHLDIVHFSRSIFEAFNVKAERTDMDYVFHSNVNASMAYFDVDKLEKVLYNLLSNAFRFSSAGGRIALDLNIQPLQSEYSQKKPDKGTVTDELVAIFKVMDHGPGISMSDREKVFDYFYRPLGKSASAGYGLGLSLVYELVKIMKGSVEIGDNEDGKGVCFVVKLPVGKKSFAPSEIIDEQSVSIPEIDEILLLETQILPDDETLLFESDDYSKTGWPLILIIEDHQDMRHFLAQNLAKKYLIIEAEEAGEGIAKAREKIPDLIISDIMMPGVDGYELVNALKNDEITCHVPIILLTAKSDLDSRIEGLNKGADDYIIKPFEIDYLLSRIENLIIGRKKLREVFGKKFDIDLQELCSNSLDSRFLQKLIHLIEENLENPDFDVDQIALSMAMSRAQLYRKLKSVSDLSVNEFVQQIRLKKAAKYILEKNKSIAEITYLVGFRDPSYFTKCFRKQFNCLPSEFTRNYHQILS